MFFFKTFFLILLLTYYNNVYSQIIQDTVKKIKKPYELKREYEEKIKLKQYKTITYKETNCYIDDLLIKYFYKSDPKEIFYESLKEPKYIPNLSVIKNSNSPEYSPGAYIKDAITPYHLEINSISALVLIHNSILYKNKNYILEIVLKRGKGFLYELNFILLFYSSYLISDIKFTKKNIVHTLFIKKINNNIFDFENNENKIIMSKTGEIQIDNKDEDLNEFIMTICK